MITKRSAPTPSGRSSLPFSKTISPPTPPLPPRAPLPPRFPTLEELLGVELQEPPVKHTGLLYELLGGSPLPIYEDAQAQPEKYPPEDREFLERVITKGPAARGSLACGCSSEHWDLNEEDRQRLDRLTLIFATANRIEPPARPLRRTLRKKPKAPERSVTELPAFWWLRTP